MSLMRASRERGKSLSSEGLGALSGLGHPPGADGAGRTLERMGQVLPVLVGGALS